MRIAHLVAAGATALLAGGAEYHYRMRGEVRLLLPWVGRDGVGGGFIRIGETAGMETIEVLFGSDPARVPGRISRWGYGFERSTRSGTRLTASVFEGFMRYSPEESVSEVRKAAKSGAVEQYQAIRSEVRTDGASSAIRLFEWPGSFDYRTAPEKLAAIRREIESRQPDKHSELVNRALYTEPCGFLVALRSELAAVAATRKPPPDTLYVHNARLHRLRTTRVAVRGADAAVDLEAVNLDKGTRTPFSVVIPLSGQNTAVPSRITLQPRWWLRLRLDLAEVRR